MAPNSIPVPSQFVDGVVKYIELTSFTTKQALDEVGVHRQSKQKAAELAPRVLELMLSSGVVKEPQKEAAAGMLGSHAETLQLLKSAVDKIIELSGQAKKAAEEPGTAVDDPGQPRSTHPTTTKQGNDQSSLTNPFVGQRTDAVKESDKPLLALIGR